MFRLAFENLKAWRYGRMQDRLDARRFDEGGELRSTAARLKAAIQRSTAEEEKRGDKDSEG